MYLDLSPEEVGAFWCLLDSEYLDGHPAQSLAQWLAKQPNFSYYEGEDGVNDRLEDVTDIACDKIFEQIRNPITAGNFELRDDQVRTIEAVFDELYP
jgi:hypothetical protein